MSILPNNKGGGIVKKLYPVILRQNEKQELKALLTKGITKARKLTRCRILLLADEGNTDAAISEALNVSLATVARIRQRYKKEGLAKAINERSRPGQPIKFSGKQKAKITALACSKAPEGKSRWTLRLLADQLVELKYVEKISYKTVERTLKKTNLSLT